MPVDGVVDAAEVRATDVRATSSPSCPCSSSSAGASAAALRLVQLVEARHPRTPHYYLGGLGTDPAWQGKGLGSAVWLPSSTAATAEGVPAYLESSKESNVPFYRRHGFEVTDEVSVPDGSVRLWLMWREPLGPPPSSSAGA